jgi:katanin p60 ATPase-containing subunit A1
LEISIVSVVSQFHRVLTGKRLVFFFQQIAKDVDVEDLARRTEGYSGDDLTNICRDASMNGMRRKIAGKTPDEIKNMTKDEMYDPVAMRDFEEALSKISRSVSTSDIDRHEKWLQEFGSA